MHTIRCQGMASGNRDGYIRSRRPNEQGRDVWIPMSGWLDPDVVMFASRVPSFVSRLSSHVLRARARARARARET
jgi:hypothetical protein